MVGLGCEVFQIGRMKEEYGIAESDTFRTMTIQETGGTRKTVAAGVERIRAMLPALNRAARTPAPASELILALQCGGSDGYSGITANPALGAAADILVRNGGTAILSETPEIYGAEHLLTRRAATPEVGQKLVERIHWWEDYCARNGGEMNNNPSPGNKAGGLTTILEKSLGAAAKGGTTALNEVYQYAEPVTAKGFVFMDTPGYDPVSATGQVAGGANVLCFTTGRGSAYGCKPTPSIKLATNNETYRRMIEDMDINCGDVLDGVSIEEKGQEIFDKFLRSRPARGPSPSCSAMATTNSPPGRSARPCDSPDARVRRPMKTALLFDLDGTLVDSDAGHLVAFQRVFAPHGIKLDRLEYAANIMGAPNAMIARRYLSHLAAGSTGRDPGRQGGGLSQLARRARADRRRACAPRLRRPARI